VQGGGAIVLWVRDWIEKMGQMSWNYDVWHGVCDSSMRMDERTKNLFILAGDSMEIGVFEG
jgi:hypothetical protein